MHSLVDSCMCPDEGWDPQPWHMVMTPQTTELSSQGLSFIFKYISCLNTFFHSYHHHFRPNFHHFLSVLWTWLPTGLASTSVSIHTVFVTKFGASCKQKPQEVTYLFKVFLRTSLLFTEGFLARPSEVTRPTSSPSTDSIHLFSLQQLLRTSHHVWAHYSVFYHRAFQHAFPFSLCSAHLVFLP